MNSIISIEICTTTTFSVDTLNRFKTRAIFNVTVLFPSQFSTQCFHVLKGIDIDVDIHCGMLIYQ